MRPGTDEDESCRCGRHDFVSTTSTTFTNISQAGVNFVQGGTGPGCVIVRFWGDPHAVNNTTMQIRAVLDNVTVALPADVRFGVPEIASVAHGYEFIFPNVAPAAMRSACSFEAPTAAA